MADYQLQANDMVLRTADAVWIPNDPLNSDRTDYEQWLADGGVPDPYVAPPPPGQTLTMEQTIMFDHENRIRSIEGEPPLTMEDFIAKMIPK